MYTVHYTVYATLIARYALRCIIVYVDVESITYVIFAANIQYTVHSVRRTMLIALYSVLCMCYTQYIVYCVQCSLYSVHTIRRVRCTDAMYLPLSIYT